MMLNVNCSLGFDGNYSLRLLPPTTDMIATLNCSQRMDLLSRVIAKRQQRHVMHKGNANDDEADL